jgi:hypothetical protein
MEKPMRLAGTPSDQLPDVLATGRTDVRYAFVSLSAREPNGRDAEYIAWHSLDHRPEQHRLPGLRNSLRLVSTPACRAARAASTEAFDAVDHVMTYLFTDLAEMPGFNALGKALGEGGRMPLRLPSLGYMTAALVDLPGVAGVWWHHGAMAEPYGGDARGRQITYCYLDGDPVEAAAGLGDAMQARWASGEVTGLLAAPFFAIVPFDWEKHLPA